MELSSIDQTLLWNPPVKGDKVKKKLDRKKDKGAGQSNS